MPCFVRSKSQKVRAKDLLPESSWPNLESPLKLNEERLKLENTVKSLASRVLGNFFLHPVFKR